MNIHQFLAGKRTWKEELEDSEGGFRVEAKFFPLGQRPEQIRVGQRCFGAMRSTFVFRKQPQES